MDMEHTFVLLKPDAVFRHCIGTIIQRIESKGLKITALRMRMLAPETAEKLYAVHKDKYFFKRLMNFITSGPVVGIVIAGPSAIEAVRNLVGPTHGKDAAAGTIRGDLGMHQTMNLIHASDSSESAAYEREVFFGDESSLDYTFPDESLIYGN